MTSCSDSVSGGVGTAGFEMVEATGGATAIGMFAELRPDVVLLDVLMPR